MIVGVVSDTHGQVHPNALAMLCSIKPDWIIHAGDAGGDEVLRALRAIAPLFAVRGNVDKQGEAGLMPLSITLPTPGGNIYVTHIGARPATWLLQLSVPLPAVVICGHSHIACIETLSGVLFVNPGAAGITPRFGRPLTMAILEIGGRTPSAEILTL